MNHIDPVTFSAPDELFPPMVAVRQALPRPRVGGIEALVRSQVEASWLDRMGTGDRVVITAGSRALADGVLILRTLVTLIRERGGLPVVLGAMGSHGGGTTAGQRDILNSLGVTGDGVGAPVLVSDEAVALGRSSSGDEVFIDPMVLEADGLVVVNRVKSHTAASGRIQSGIMKMMVVGLGRRPGAESVHRLGPEALSRAVEERARVILRHAPVLGAVAVIENGYGETADIVGLTPGEIESREPGLLRQAAALVPSIPCREADVLVVGEMGKDISGTGMDARVIGRMEGAGADGPRFSRVAVLDLTAASNGNANGIGLSDLTTLRLFQKIDFPKTHVNGLTTGLLHRTALPMVMDTDRSAVGAAIATSRPGGRVPGVVWITSTRRLDRMCVSRPVLETIEDASVTAEGARRMVFDGRGTLEPM